VSGGIRIDKTGDALSGSLVWRSGSYAPVKSVEVKDGVLRIVRGEVAGKQDIWEARLEGGRLKGQVTYLDGKVQHFEGRKAPPLVARTPVDWGKPVTLFDGKTLTGWRLRDPKAKNGWAVVDGELAVVEPKGNADLVTNRTFQDMKLHLEFNVDAKSNSGVFLRGRYEVQILDNPDAKMALDTHGCGAIYSRLAPSVDASKPAGEWQSLDIEFVGRQVTVTLNGHVIVDANLDKVKPIDGHDHPGLKNEKGRLGFLGHGDQLQFRNVRVKEL
jgi:hypothetical protein